MNDFFKSIFDWMLSSVVIPRFMVLFLIVSFAIAISSVLSYFERKRDKKK